MTLADINIDESHGWRLYRVRDKRIWLKGYLIVDNNIYTGDDAAARLANLPASAAALKRSLSELDGLFAAVIEAPDSVVAVVDRVASVPLLYGIGARGLVFDATADRLVGRLGGRAADLNLDGALALAMSGFTIGADSLYRGVRRLQSGEVVIVSKDGVTSERYYRYTAWEIEDTTPDRLAKSLRAILRQMFERLVEDLGARTVVVPLSAGLDSRLIATGLQECGYKNVKCFAYGLPGNFEACASREIAERLGYPWTFVPYGRRRQQDVFSSTQHDDYLSFAETYTAVPFEQDFLAIRELTESGWLPSDAVVINGQSGDFITGAHIPQSLIEAGEADGSGSGRSWDTVLDALIEKHHSLWSTLKTKANVGRIRDLLIRELQSAGVPETLGNGLHGAYEFCEFENRQSKYVCGGQRVYEFFGLEWRMPLWETDFVDFWRTAPLAAKADRGLFRSVVTDLNWGGVWHGVDAPSYVSPLWIRPLRLAAKLGCAPLGQRAWHNFERRYFAYWMDLLANYVVAPYPRVRRDRRGFRNAVSWLTEAYLAGKDLDWRGQPAP